MKITGEQAAAKYYEVSSKTIQEWRAKGLPAMKEGRAFIFDTDVCDAWVTAYRKPLPAATADPSYAQRVKLEREVAKLRIEEAKAAKLEREEEIEQGNLLPRDEWDLFAVEVIQLTRDRFMRLPIMLGKHVTEKFRKVLRVEGEKDVRKICAEMKRLLEKGKPE